MLKRGKKGQVTIFIIVAILIIGGIVAFFVLRDNFKGESGVQEDIAPIKNFVDSCIESEIEDAVYLIGEGGGYFFPPGESTEGGFTYYFYEDKNYFPSKSKIEEQLTNAIAVNIAFCVNNFEDFSSYNVEKGIIEIETEILEEEVVFDVNFPLKITLDEEIYNLKEFGEFKVPVRLGLIHNSIYNLIKEGYYDGEHLCLDCFAELVFVNNLNVSFLDAGEGNSIFIIEDYNEETNKTFVYAFAV